MQKKYGRAGKRDSNTKHVVFLSTRSRVTATPNKKKNYKFPDFSLGRGHHLRVGGKDCRCSSQLLMEHHGTVVQAHHRYQNSQFTLDAL